MKRTSFHLFSLVSVAFLLTLLFFSRNTAYYPPLTNSAAL